MRIAIFGATSEIARDLIAALVECVGVELFLYARRPQELHGWLAAKSKSGAAVVYAFDDFPPVCKVDVIINFVGVGNPAQARLLGASILDITQAYDEMAIEYIRKHSNCRYIFLSSGAVYGGRFERPITTSSLSQIRLNNLQGEDWYSIAKLYTECRHRAFADMGIIDLRVFSYFSHTQNMSSSFFMADVIRAIASGNILRTSSTNIIRDYLHPSDFHCLIRCLLEAPMVNTALDCYSLNPIDKFSLLDAMRSQFDLKYEISNVLCAGDVKLKYYSLSRLAESFGYKPSMSSLDGVLLESEELFSKHVI